MFDNFDKNCDFLKLSKNLTKIEIFLNELTEIEIFCQLWLK